MPLSETKLTFRRKADGFLKNVLIPAFIVSLSFPALAQQTKIGFIDTQRVFREAGAAKSADAKIARDFTARDKEIKELGARLKRVSETFEKEGPTLTEAERIKRYRDLSDLSRDFQRKQAEFREDLSQRQSREHSLFSERALAVVKRIAEAENYDLVVDKSAWSNPRVDITEKVIKALEK
ncbi:MAG: OmpH family outer membrane protein [Herminiimonas sp.]|nr:OmpH family outer membrane protein [Herminiimonas sp.]